MMRTFTLLSGDQIPAIGLGTWKSSEAEVGQAVKMALASGYQHIDCAAIYLNEGVIGQTLEESIKNKVISREKLWVTSKLWNSYHAPEDVEPALKESLGHLRLDYLDLYLIHWPVAFKRKIGLNIPETGEDFLSLDAIPLADTWQAMEALVDKGLVKNIGVSNFSISKLQMLLKQSKYKPAVNQVECHPYLAQTELMSFCREQGIHVTAYSPLGSGDRPDMLKKTDEPSLLQNPVIVEIAKTHRATPAQILIAWQVVRKNSVIPKSIHEKRIKENLAAQDIQLSEEDLKRINALDKNYRFLDGSFWEMKHSPYKAESFWD
ncbi:aldo/keto reductase [Aquicella lusitana]|uniref:Alcohol dehydrogenase (NADP+) n=1 Tax=Aquicella lusitana TaxID=254246 RepID=A0A370GMZ4_9COXI|nr:aldo/keto reductase [Aquicella lusitana]RDI44770.1 alcohol dehydrogenase (NADP+) [Aquicella lusitana]VVC72967.1 Aldo/keto reductase [Aquicella lusitana]